jgi:hypothetical protein
MSTTTALWQQPRRQRFDTESSTLGGQLAIRIDYPLHELWSIYVETDRKTAGWVAGNVYLDANTSVRTGLLKRW